jgi:hypothetical protein
MSPIAPTPDMRFTAMPQKIRDLYLLIWAGVSPVHDVTSHLHYLDSMFPREKLEEALKYLVGRGITGKNFIEWFNIKCAGSHLGMHRELMRAVERERYQRRLTVQKDLQK